MALHSAVPVAQSRPRAGHRLRHPLHVRESAGGRWGLRGGTQHRVGGRAGRVPAGARGEHVGLRWCWGDAAGKLVTLLNFSGEMSWCLTGC